MAKLLLLRAVHSMVAVFVLIVLVFFMARLTGSPADLYLPIGATLEMRDEFNRMHGFDRPIIVQFGDFLLDLLRLDFGMSIRTTRPAMELVLNAIPTTLALAGVTMCFVIGLAILVGSLAAFRPRSVFDRIAGVISIVAASTPDFWVAITAIMVFAVALDWLPTSGLGGPIYWIMPVAVLALRPFGTLVQVVRNSMLSALQAPYTKTARAKGIVEQRVVFVHALRNAMLPVITVAADKAAGMANGAVIVETIFGWPGVGKLMIDSILQRDFAVIQASIFVTACVIFIVNFFVDLAYLALDPRVRSF